MTATDGGQGVPRPTELRVEREADPANVDPATDPRFSWRVDPERRGAGQSAYRVVVGRERDAVADGRGAVWDSGRVESDTATDVRYRGPALAADETYYWSVRCWTAEDEATPWADPGRFSTALRPEDWSGEWIAHQPDAGDTNGWRSRWRPADWSGEEWVQVDLGGPRDIEAIALHPAEPVTIVRTPDDAAVTESFFRDPLTGFGFPDGYRVEIATEPGFEDATVIAEVTPEEGDDSDAEVPSESDGESEGDAEAEEEAEEAGADPQVHDGLSVRGQYVRVTATELSEVRPSTWMPADQGSERHTEQVDTWRCFALAAVTVQDGASDGDGDDLAAGRPVTASSSVETDAWGRNHLVNDTTESRVASTSPLLRTEFELDGTVRNARAHLAAVGYGELHVNGERVGNRRLDPAWTDYEQRILAATYDVTDHLSTGGNALGLWLGRGWFSKRQHAWVGDGSPRARLNLTVEFEDGRTRTVVTDGDWRAVASPVVENDLYDGERYDARREREGWRSPGFDDADWDAAAVVDPPGGALRPQRVEPMRVVDSFDVEAVHEHLNGPILDFGQNLTGWLEVEVEGASEGDEIVLQHAEALTEDGDLSTTDLRTADATDTYVARGADREAYEPRFTYHGFRYAQVSTAGVDGSDAAATVDPESVTANVVHTAMDRRGEFDCSNPDLRQVQHNAVWGLRSNTHAVPEDCPQRDERLGWTGDAHISGRALLFNFDAARFQEKWARDHDDVASPMGYVGDVIPNKDHEVPADPTWSITRVMLPWYCYLHDGDTGILREQYEGMRRYVDYWHSVTDEAILPAEYGKFGDWLAFENTDGRRGLPHDLFNTAFHYQVTDTFAKIAEVLGNEADGERYHQRADGIAAAFNDRFFDAEEGVYGPGTQSSYAVPLFLGLVPDEAVDRVVANLAEKVRADGSKLQSGFLGTRPLIHTLAAHGRTELAYEVVSQPERPGWVYMVRQGATTMWERWDSDEQVGSGMNSLNHSPFTHVSEFCYEVLAGLRLGDRPVTDHVTIAPAFVEDLDWAEGSVETPNGTLASAWERRDDGAGCDVSVTVPWNASATVRLPRAGNTPVTESGVRLGGQDGDRPPGVVSVEEDQGDLVVEVRSGQYEFTIEQ